MDNNHTIASINKTLSNFNNLSVIRWDTLNMIILHGVGAQE